MAILNQKRILNLIPKVSAPVTIHVSQGDVGTEIEFTLVKGDEVFVNPGNVTASVHGVREDGANFGPFTCTLSGSKVTFPLHSEMTAVKGSALAEIVLVDNGGNKVGSANFGILVEESVFPLGVTYDNDVSVYESILAYVQTIPAQVTEDYNTKITLLNEALASEASTRASADITMNARIDELVAPSGEAPSAAEVTDARIGGNGTTYASLGTAIRTQYDILNRYHGDDKYNIESILGYHDEFYFDYEQGSINGSTGADATNKAICRSLYYTFTKPTDLVPKTVSGYSYLYFMYNADGTFVEYHGFSSVVHITDLTKKYRIRIAKSDNTQIDIDYARTLVTFIPTKGYKSIPQLINDGATKEQRRALKQNVETILGYYEEFQFAWENGGIALSTGIESDDIEKCRTEFLKFSEDTIVHFDYDSTIYKAQYLMYDANGTFVEYHNQTSDLLLSDTMLNYQYRFRIEKLDRTEMDISEAKTLVTFNPLVYSSIPELIESVVPANKPLTGKKIVCFGDSITGNPINPYDYPYKLALLTGATVINAGFGGTNMASVDERAVLSMSDLADSIASGDWSSQTESSISITSGKPNNADTQWQSTGTNYVPTRTAELADIDWNEVDYIIIFFGTNDWNDRVPLDNSNNAYDTTTYKGAFRHAVEQIWSEYPHIKILPITPMWRWFTESTDSDNTPKSQGGMYLYEYVTALKEVAKEYHLHVTDMYYESGICKYNKSKYFYSNDGTHVNPYGTTCLAQKIANELSYSLAI